MGVPLTKYKKKLRKEIKGFSFDGGVYAHTPFLKRAKKEIFGDAASDSFMKRI